MSNPEYSNRPPDAVSSDVLVELALDLRWSFNHAADKIWERLDPELWGLTHNPWVVLQTVSRAKLQSVTSDPDFRSLVANVHGKKAADDESDGWFQRAYPHSALSSVAYFSME